MAGVTRYDKTYNNVYWDSHPWVYKCKNMYRRLKQVFDVLAGEEYREFKSFLADALIDVLGTGGSTDHQYLRPNGEWCHYPRIYYLLRIVEIGITAEFQDYATGIVDKVFNEASLYFNELYEERGEKLTLEDAIIYFKGANAVPNFRGDVREFYFEFDHSDKESVFKWLGGVEPYQDRVGKAKVRDWLKKRWEESKNETRG